MLSAAVDIVKKEGPATLLSGLGPTVVGYGIEGAMKVCDSQIKFIL
jgi:solute carrier family 25 (mitochondrial phosphate transporter), member 3